MKISYADLKQCSDELHSTCKNINATLDNISNIKDKITRGEYWVGKASEHYVNKLRTLSNTFDEVFSELQKTALYLDKILGDYTTTDQTIIGRSNNMNFNTFRYTRLK